MIGSEQEARRLGGKIFNAGGLGGWQNPQTEELKRPESHENHYGSVPAIECIHPIHQSQVMTYLKLSDCPAGLLLNFNVTAMKAGVKRLNHPDLYTPKKKELPS